MKTALYPVLLLVALSSCRHQRMASASANANDYSYNSTSSTTTTASIDSTVTTTVTTSTSTTTNVSANSSDSVTTVVSAGGNQSADTSKIYRITISFTSNGTGVKANEVDDFENWLKAQPKNLAYDKTQYGREGETSFCLKLNELSTREQEIFVRDVRTKLSDKQLVFVDEYAECKGHKVN
ncbi:MAG TPA: hypothetical protein VL651_15285 [Bacteroidia bacterium]|jgi:hypothetical protein|nr:hypothetical protein [Bacteroidia bacterium]